MLDLDHAINLSFRIEATDPLGREEVIGKLRFLPEICELHWRLSSNVFRGGKGTHQIINIPYSDIGGVDLQKRWLRPSKISLHINNPTLVKDIPNVEMGRLTFTVDKKSTEELNRLKSYIDFKQSIFIFQQADDRLDQLKE